MKTVLKAVVLSCAIASGLSAGMDTRLTLGWPQGLGSAGRLIGENALPMKHDNRHSLDMNGVGSWWVDGEQYAKALGLKLSYSYDLGNGFFTGVDGMIGGASYNFVKRDKEGNVRASSYGYKAQLHFDGAFFGYFSQMGPLELTNMVMLEGVGDSDSAEPGTKALAYAGEGAYKMFENETGLLSWSGVWYYQYALPSKKAIGHYHNWQLNRGHLIDFATGPVWSAKNWFGGATYGFSALNLNAHSEISVDQKRKDATLEKRGTSFTETVTAQPQTAPAFLHKAVAHVGIRNENASLTVWGSLPLEGGTPTVGISASCNF